MNLKQLETFRAVMIAGTMVGGAKLLRISQPAVSHTIGQLEREIGIQLFKRQNSRLYPTPEADLLFVETERVYAGVKELERLAEGLRFNRYGSLRLAGFPAISRNVLPQIASEYCRDKPDIHVSLHSTQSRNIANLVARREIDLALSALPSDRDEVAATIVSTLRAVCVLPRSHSLCGKDVIHADDLAGESVISLGKSDPTSPLIDKVFDTLGVHRRLKVETGQSDTACGFVAASNGIAIVDELTASWYKDDRIVFRRFEPKISFKVWLLRSRATRQSQLTHDFSSFMQARIIQLINILHDTDD